MIERLYWRLFNRLCVPEPRPMTAWAWRRAAALLEMRKHIRRRNWKQALTYFRML